MASPGPVIFFRGFRFTPTPLEAATYYLPRLIAGAPLHEAVRAVVHNADVYACEPGDLARQFGPLPRTGNRYFFTHCKLQKPQRAGKASKATRATGAGSWHSQSVTDVVDRAGVKVGEVRKLKYKKGGAYTDWLMDEYSTCCLEDAVAGDKQFVLCNMYVSPRADKNSVALQESDAFFAPPAPAPVVIAAASKRPAPQSTEPPPCPKRMRGAVPPTPPVVQPAGCTAAYAPPPPYTTASAQPPCPKQMRGAFAPMPPVAQPPDYCTASLAPPLPYVPHIAAPAQLPPPPVPTRLAAPASTTPLQPRSLPKQLSPPPTLPVVSACHMPVRAPGTHCQQPQPSVQRKQRTRDPFEAAEQDEDDWTDLQKCMDMDDTVPTADGETMTEDEMDQHFSSLLEEEIPDAIAPDPAYTTKSSLQDDLDLFDKMAEEILAADDLAWT